MDIFRTDALQEAREKMGKSEGAVEYDAQMETWRVRREMLYELKQEGYSYSQLCKALDWPVTPRNRSKIAALVSHERRKRAAKTITDPLALAALRAAGIDI